MHKQPLRPADQGGGEGSSISLQENRGLASGSTGSRRARVRSRSPADLGVPSGGEAKRRRITRKPKIQTRQAGAADGDVDKEEMRDEDVGQVSAATAVPADEDEDGSEEWAAPRGARMVAGDAQRTWGVELGQPGLRGA